MSDTPVELKYAYRLSAIRLQNFMAFEDTGWIDLRPITLLFGRNSSGKSAIIRALLLLKQSLESRDANAPLIFSGSLVDLGSYYNAVHRHDLERDISFGFRLSRPPFEEPPPDDSASEEEKTAFEKRQKEYEDNSAAWLHGSSELPRVDVDDSPLELCLTFGLADEHPTPILKSLAIYGYRTPDDGQPKAVLVFQMVRRNDGSWQPQSDAPLDYETVEGEGDERRSIKHEQFSNELWKNLVPDMRDGCIPRRLWLPDAANFLRSDRPPDWQLVDAALEFFWDRITSLLRGMVYLPPLREEPRRYYRADHGWVREITKNDDAQRKINSWLCRAAINAEVRAEPLNGNEGVVAVYLREGSQLDSNLRDVGSGVSQVLPIIIGSIQASAEGRLIIVEQPELHLHPRVQAELADEFISLATKGLICVLETHSVSIINRIRLRVAEKELSASYFSALFVKRSSDSSKCSLITLEEDGHYACELDSIEEFFGVDTDEFTLLETASISKELKDKVKRLRVKLQRYESLFDGEKVRKMFAILGIYPRSAVQMMRVWAEYVCIRIAEKKNISTSNKKFSETVKELYDNKVIDQSTKQLVEEVRRQGNINSHASKDGIKKLSIKDACYAFECLVELLDSLQQKGLINQTKHPPTTPTTSPPAPPRDPGCA